MAYLDLTATESLMLEATEELVGKLLPYFEENQVTRVVVGLRPQHSPMLEVLVQAVQAQCDAIGVEFIVRETA
jgi:hypothetical protein